ncbi:dyrk [Arthroderma uncinatum]|uniref:dyrk n=1 Tax=Arthroderma uncinatum TaxID=74035 RepID=UPI00144A7000|nr:dyrk [Arthroderma uncinatum]KAF3491062.1 dyrk [Arthroderma uncinatum]
MPADMTSQRMPAMTQQSIQQSKPSEPSRPSETRFYAQTNRKPLQRNSPIVPVTNQTPFSSLPSHIVDQQIEGSTSKRRKSIREQSPTIGGPVSTRRTTIHSHSGSQNQSETPFPKAVGNHTPPESSEFLPAINFDDFHNSISSKEPSLSHFPMPGQLIPGFGSAPSPSKSTPRWSTTPSTTGPKSARPTTLARRQSNAAAQRPDGEGVAVGGASNSMGQPPAPVAARARRQSHVAPPTSSIAVSRPPRKSIGPGALVTSHTNGDDGLPRRRQSFAKRNAAGEIRVNTGANRTSHQPTEQSTGPSFLNTTRSQKAKSLQAVSRGNRDTQITPSGGSDHSRSSSNTAIRTPGKGTTGSNTNQSSKRSSIMPHHPTGLGARTISPTDARRMKRMSLVPNPPPIPQRSPTQLELGFPRPRSSAQSPSMIPRKSVTPSSARTTPDPHRKSYSSGISLSSNTTYNSARNSSGSLQGRLSQTVSTSRLPTPKPRTEHSSQEEEEVPPVPAIPKAYESPKSEGPIPPTFTPRQTSMPFELEARKQSLKDPPPTAEVEAPSTPSNQTSMGDARMHHDSRVFSSEFKPRAAGNHGKRSLQPLKLPPLNLMPLSGPVASKINALRDREVKEPVVNPSTTPPPPRQMATKTPTTPMTASKTTFPSHITQEPTPIPILASRSNSSQFTLPYQTGYRAQNSSSALDFMGLSSNRTMSPYISSSLPRGSEELNSIRDKVASKPSTSKLTGPRPQTQISTISTSDTFSFKYEPDCTDPDPSPTVVPPSPPRKISLDQVRHVGGSDVGSGDTAKFDNMPPPKLPASAIVNNVSRTSPASNTNYAPAKRKQSISNVVASISSRRNKSLSGEPGPTVVTRSSMEMADEAQPVRNSSSILNPVQRLLGGPRPSPAPAPKPRVEEGELDRDDLAAEEEMRKLGSKRKDFESAARELDELRRRAGPKERASPAQALKIASLNIFERGEIIDYKDIYFCGTHKAKKHVGDLNTQTANFGYDDDRGDYNIVMGDHIAYRYEIVDLLGKGSFGQVVRCVDHKTGTLVAVKIIRNKKRFHQQALVEVNILQKLKEWDPQNRHSVVNFTQSFYFRGHLCISTELLGINLYEFIKAHDFRGFSLKIIRRFTKQMLMSLILLHNHKVVHCDMKPENVLLVHPLRGDIKVIDFGSSCFENEKVYTYIQSRFYRSPEVILELYTGYPLFPGENEQEQLACIMEIFGPPEKHLIEKSTRKKLFFDSSGKPRLTVSSKGRRRKPSSTDLRQALKCDNSVFLDFIARCLRWDPNRRLTPRDAMQHEFITGIRAPPRPTRSHMGSLHHTHSQSPVKRFASTGNALNGRPLPNPPSNAMNSDGPRLRDSSTNSPVKPGLPKRHSTFHHTTSTSATNPGLTPKRSSNVPPSGGSALPRVAPRNASGKPDLAAAAATTSLRTGV